MNKNLLAGIIFTVLGVLGLGIGLTLLFISGGGTDALSGIGVASIGTGAVFLTFGAIGLGVSK